MGVIGSIMLLCVGFVYIVSLSCSGVCIWYAGCSVRGGIFVVTC